MAIELTVSGKSGYRIVIAQHATQSNHYAAAQLAHYLEAVTGARLPVVTDDTPAQDREMVLGGTNRPASPCVKDLKNDGYRIKTQGERLFIVGENDRAVLYGVYGLLENYLDCRFLTHDVEIVPQRADVVWDDIDDTQCPTLEYRETFWHEPQHYPDYAMKRGLNASITVPLESKHGGGVQYWGFAHTLFNYVSPKEYFDTHPEYFSMVGGIRIRQETQLCLTNPEVLAITKKKLRQNIIDHPECKIFSLTQMDWYNPCQCPECAKVDAEEGSYSGTLLRFVNACAASIADEFPDVVIDTFAYQYTRQPPKLTRPLPNVCVRICSIECCFTHPLRSCDAIVRPFKYIATPGVTFQQDLIGWSKICKRIFVWDYTTNYRFYMAPMPNFHVLQDNLNFFIENGVTGMFEQGNGQSTSGEFGELRAYLIAKLLWNPKGDFYAWMDEFLAGYYGEASAKPIRAYIDLLKEYVTEYHVHGGIYESPMDLIPNALIPRMDALWDEAEALCDDPAQLERIRKSRLQVKFTKQHRRRLTDADFTDEAEAFIADVEHHKVDQVQEGRDRAFSFAQIRTGYLPDSWASFWRPQPVEIPRKTFSGGDE